MGCKKTKVFLHPIFRGLEKMRRMDKLSDNKASALLSATGRRTGVRRVAKFVHSIKHYYIFVFGLLLLLTPFIVIEAAI